MQAHIGLRVCADHQLLEPDESAPALLYGALEGRMAGSLQLVSRSRKIGPGLGLGKACVLEHLFVVKNDPAGQFKRHGIGMVLDLEHIAGGGVVLAAGDKLLPYVVERGDLAGIHQVLESLACPPREHIGGSARGDRGLHKRLVLFRCGVGRLHDLHARLGLGGRPDGFKLFGPEALVVIQRNALCFGDGRSQNDRGGRHQLSPASYRHRFLHVAVL